MHPELLSIGSFTIHSYGFFIVIGFLTCVALIRKKAKLTGENPEHLTDLAFWSLVCGLAGGRVLFVITQWQQFAKDPIAIFKFWEGGLVFYGGFIAGVATYAYLAKKYKIPILKSLDIAIPSVAIAHMFGRFGCFAAGCCYGKPLDEGHPFSVVFTHAKTVAPQGIHLHPAQLYDALNIFIVFIILEWAFKKKKFDGQVMALYLMIYAIGRSIVEVYRGDKIRGFVIQDVLSTSQFIAIILFTLGALLYWKAKKLQRLD